MLLRDNGYGIVKTAFAIDLTEKECYNIIKDNCDFGIAVLIMLPVALNPNEIYLSEIKRTGDMI